MIDPLALTKIAVSCAPIAKWLRSRNDSSFAQVRDEIFRGWTAELAIASQELRSTQAQLEGKIAMLEARLEELESSREFNRILNNYGYEAAREAIDERRRMLAYAAVGGCATELTIAQLARVERTVRELDPADVTLLHAIAKLVRSEVAERNSPKGQAAFERWSKNPESGHVLHAAGCVFLRSPPVFDAQDEAFVTPIGLWVLEVLELYLGLGEGAHT